MNNGGKNRWNVIGKFAKHSRFLFVLPNQSFGNVYFYHPISTKDKNWPHQFSSKVLKNIFFGNALGAERGWTGDVLVADAEDVKDNIAPAIYVKRFKT